MRLKVCKDCGESKPLEKFYPTANYVQSYCKDCRKIRSSIWAKNNPERNRAKALKYLHKNA